MSINHSDNAMLAKVRAMYGRRLTEDDYKQLLQKKSVGEVAAFLKAETYYAEDLTEVKEDLIHREQLENLVRRRLLQVYLRLRAYAGRQPLFLRLYVMQNEIEQLLVALRMFNAGRMDRYIIALPVHLARLMSFDLFSIPKIESYDDLLDLLQHSAYYSILYRFRPGSGKAVDVTACETALLTHYYTTALELVARQYSGDTRDDLRRLLLYRLNSHNLSVIYRMRRYQNAPRDTVAARIVSVEGANRRLYERLLDAPDIPAMQQQLLQELRPLRRSGFRFDGDVLHITGRILNTQQQVNRRIFRFSTRPAVAVIAYMALLEVEIDNIVHIIESIRYGLTPAEMEPLLAL